MVAFALVVCLGLWLPESEAAQRVAPQSRDGRSGVLQRDQFRVWAFTPLYPKTLNGLIEWLRRGDPFFWNTLAGDLVYSTVLFGGLMLAEKRCQHWGARTGRLAIMKEKVVFCWAGQGFSVGAL